MAEPNPELSDLKIAPKFTEIFFVEDAKHTYGDFIAAVRKGVVKYCTNRAGVIQPVLPPEKKLPEFPVFWFYVELRTEKSSITLAIRMDNLYLVGFRTPAGVWWEFGKEGNTHLLDNTAKWLGFGDRYQDLIGANKGPDTVTMGRDEMVAAVDNLAKKTTMTLDEEEEQQLLLGADQAAAADPQGDAKKSLVTLVVMVCEGVRFMTVSRKVDEAFKNKKKVNLTQMEGKQVQKWDRISSAVLLKWAKDPDAVIDEMMEFGIRNKNEAAKIVAIVKDQN